MKHLKNRVLPLFFLLMFLLMPLLFFAQSVDQEEQGVAVENAEQVEVPTVTRDDEIQQRLVTILDTTGWFSQLQVNVRKGVVFLNGTAGSEESKKWAGNLAKGTQGVVAVVNNMEIAEPAAWNFAHAMQPLKRQALKLVHLIPSLLLGTLILCIAWGLARLGKHFTRSVLHRHKLHKTLLEGVIVRGVGAFIFLIGVYFIFEMADLTGAAFTIISGTGLLGIVLGIAFRDIIENFLASVLLSIHHPFQTGDLIEIEGLRGYVQGMTMRVTILMALDGNYIQIPNAIVYKSNIRNYTSNPNRRDEFVIGIDYDSSIAKAQEIALGVLDKHEAVLKDPEPWVLADSMGKATVNLKIFFWINGLQHSTLKVRSSLIRLVKQEFETAGITIPDEAREVIFPKGIDVRTHEKEGKRMRPHVHKEAETELSEGEAELRTEADDIKEQAKQARVPEKGKNLLDNPKEEK